jgi:cytochrome c oxidase subunit 2
MTQRSIRRGATVALFALVAAGCASDSDKQQNTLKPAGKGARDILHLFTPFFWIAVVIGIGVTFATVFFAIKYRERPGNENPRQVHGNTRLEITWTIVPALIMIVMAVFTVKLIWAQATTHKGALEVTVTGKQWWWEFTYTNNGKQVFTANELHIPAGRYVDVTEKSDNVIHSFWVPNLNGKKDVMPGHANQWWIQADASDAGKVYYGQCAEYCGLSHADMGLKVFVDSPADFQKWYQTQLPGWTQSQVDTFNKLISYTGADGKPGSYGCTSCHYIKGMDPQTDAQYENGQGQPINVGPNLTHLDERTTFASRKYDLTYDNLWQWVWDAPAHRAGEFGKPNECPRRGPGGEVDTYTKNDPCRVGMPSFKDDPVVPMSQQTAQAIANFLLGIDPKPVNQ